MANVLLTEACVRSCPYCFAKEYMYGKKNQYLSWKNLIQIADLHIQSGERISLLGGEPSLHPHFVDFILYLVKRNIHVNIFTSGIASENKLDEMISHLYPLSPEWLSFVVNLNHPDISPASQQKRVDKFLTAFGHYSSISFNIYDINFDLKFVFDAILQYGLKRTIRFGLAQPIPGEKNNCIPKNRLPEMIEKLMSYEPIFDRLQIHVGFDCGMPMCLFDDRQIGALYKMSQGRVHFGCGPAVDIGVDMSVWPCFPLSRFHRKKVSDFNTLTEIRNYYTDLHRKTRGEMGGIYKECDECKYRKQNMCLGGCLAYVLSDIENEPKIRHEEVYLEAKKT
jgi:radical SAM protein with 4Fe4S-binding SPASM domain